MIAENKLYQDDRKNCIFIGFDINSNSRYALRMGTNPKYKFKGEVKGSDKAFAPSPRYNPKEDSVAVFESVIDALSYESMNSVEDLNTIALSGISSLRLEQYLKENRQTKTIILMLDNDETGINASKELASRYSEKGYNVMIHLPRKHKDWNEELVAKVNGDEKQSILKQIRVNRSILNNSIGTRKKSVGIDILILLDVVIILHP